MAPVFFFFKFKKSLSLCFFLSIDLHLALSTSLSQKKAKQKKLASQELAEDVGPALLRVLEALEHQNAGPFAHDEPVPPLVPRPRRPLRLVAAARQRTAGDEAAEADGDDGRLGAADDHQVRVSRADVVGSRDEGVVCLERFSRQRTEKGEEERGELFLVHPFFLKKKRKKQKEKTERPHRRARRRDRVVGPHEPGLDPDERPPHVGDRVRDEERRDLLEPLLDEVLHAVLEDGEPAHPRADHHAATRLVEFLERLGADADSGVDESLLGGDNGVGEAVVVAAGVLLVDEAAFFLFQVFFPS